MQFNIPLAEEAVSQQMSTNLFLFPFSFPLLFLSHKIQLQISVIYWHEEISIAKVLLSICNKTKHAFK